MIRLIQLTRLSAECNPMKCCHGALLAVLAAVMSLVSACGSKVKSPEKVATPAAAKKETPVAAREAPKKEPAVAAPEAPKKKESQDPAWVSEIKLKGIGGTSTRRLAIINGKTLGAGDGIQVKAGGKILILRCIAINEKSVTVDIEGLEGERELRLN